MKAGTKVRYKDPVRQAEVGCVGVVESEWGSWYACKRCHEEIDGELESCPLCGFGGNPNLVRGWDDLGPIALRVSGEGVFNVKFGDEIRFINKCWLRRA